VSFVPRRYILRPLYTKASAKIHIYAKRKVSFELLNFLDQDVKLGDRVDIRKHSALDEAEKPEAEPKEKTTAVLQVTGGAWTGWERTCAQVHRSSPNLCTGRPPTECDDTRCCIIEF